jgi:DNA-directed RNA polymerase subunit N (RpoN/RPB10)
MRTMADNAYKFTEQVKEQFLELLREGNSRRKALEACGVTRYTLRNHMIADPTFKERVAEAEAEAIDIVEDALFQRCIKGNVTAQLFYLCNRRPDRWKSVNKLQDNTNQGFSRQELEQKLEQFIEFAIQRIPEEEREGFISDLRRLSGLDEGSGYALEAPRASERGDVH